ncbi:hypothetical protein P153DRAFT_385561 [Dothidotthia symphoricarpi CBS 119687]|uniref:Uncharacterized protein n=1 Tax=Dothidotthia symphoricarpi CBS 119687 TaxID=1392245 RepID=A0A6A6AC38_9PLEO|nr:uncharacterized protein P153DRAFT_385561 [Dothidotthia symphoricarpi CBS 119687]KAF2129350.1 hypothetical protein P153DRAFT_385561 [Dothidotthia symphoricarpi CBS 119687]
MFRVKLYNAASVHLRIAIISSILYHSILILAAPVPSTSNITLRHASPHPKITPRSHIQHEKMRPALIMVFVVCGLLEFWLIFAILYALMKRNDNRVYWARFKDAVEFKL